RKRSRLYGSARSAYLMNSRIAGVEDADLVLLVGTNPRYEAPTLAAAKRPLVLLGSEALCRPDGRACTLRPCRLSEFASTENESGQSRGSRLAVFNLLPPGCQPGGRSGPGLPGRAGAATATMEPPLRTPSCRESPSPRRMPTYVNTEARAQQTRLAVSSPGAAREDWKIVRALSELAGAPLPYDNLNQPGKDAILTTPGTGPGADRDSAVRLMDLPDSLHGPDAISPGPPASRPEY
uniref:Molybdopterin domain-containing protein n=1 Tax=Macrostomum lignano TaxID=282301 RepID=A0A1I8FJW9_9PLAT